ncbi:interleukin-17F-like [Engystomops pustulosus]|uniref:interleukin-17F-like n=1 Tax=Engystomops pustulosus TaxID=76066 RepID=UPI003AFA37B9
MRQLWNRLPWQVVIVVVALGLISHPVDGSRGSNRKKKCPKAKTELNCLQVRVDKPVKNQEDVTNVRNFRERNIVPFHYRTFENPGGYPAKIVEVVCSDKCMDNDLNVAQIRRNIHYLKREENLLVLKEMVLTVGCTCINPEVREQT